MSIAVMRMPDGYPERRASVSACESCGNSSGRLDTDHCHIHGWARGQVCSFCNRLLARVDRGVRMAAIGRPGYATIEQVLAIANRCPDCPTIHDGDLRHYPYDELPGDRGVAYHQMVNRAAREFREREAGLRSLFGEPVTGAAVAA